MGSPQSIWCSSHTTPAQTCRGDLASPESLALWLERDRSMDINLNLATKPFIDLRPILKWLRTGTTSLAVLALMVGTLAYIVHRKAERTRRQARGIEEKISDLRHERRAYQEALDHSDNMRIRRETDGLNEIL